MLLQTGIIRKMSQVIGIVGSWNIIPMQYPYQLYHKSKNRSYKFGVNPLYLKSHWILHCFVFLIAGILGSFRAILDATTVFDKAAVLFFVYFSIMFILTTCFHKVEAINFSNFLNQLIKFETGNTFRKFSNIQVPTKTDRHCQLVSFVSRLFSIALLVHSILYALSCGIMPEVPWNMVPSKIYQVTSSVSDEALKRCLLTLYLYITMRVFSNSATINIVINFFIPTYWFCSSLKVLQDKMSNLRLHNDTLDQIKIYRQINILCIIYNSIHRKSMAPLMVLGAIACFATPAFLLISRIHQIYFGAVSVFVNLLEVGVALTIISFYFAAIFNKISLKTLAKFKKCVVVMHKTSSTMQSVSTEHTRNMKFIRRNLVSLCSLKIRFLHSNYFDQLTPLIFFKFSLRLAINLSLVEQ